MPDFSGGWSKLVEKLVGWIESLILMLPNLVLAVITIVIAVWVGRWVQRGVHRLVLRISDNRPFSDLLGAIARIGVVLTAAFVALEMLSLDKTVTSLLAGIGVVGLALGFACQDIAANFMSGFIMAVRRPFDVGDLVEVNGRFGQIRAIEMRATEVETPDGLTVLIPNKDVMQNAIVNYTKTPGRRLDLEVGTAYANDMEKVRTVTIAAVQDVPHRDNAREVEVFFTGFGDSSIEFVVRIWLTRAGQLEWVHARSEALIALKKAFNREGIRIPFPIRTLDFGASVVGGERMDAMGLRAAAGPAER